MHGCFPVERADASNSLIHDFEHVYRMKKPLIIQNYANTGSSIKEWCHVDHFIPRITSQETDVLIARDGRHFMKHEFCKTYQTTAATAIKEILEEKTSQRMYCRLYLDQESILAGEVDLNYMSTLVQGSSQQPHHFTPKNIGIWTSTAGCVTPLHYDTCHGFLLQVHGRKRFLLASPDDSMYLYRQNSIHCKNQMTSEVNLTSWIENDADQRKRYSKVHEVNWFVAELFPGDMLYTPPGWWHHVTSLDTSISLLCPFDMEGDESLSTLLSL